MDDISGDELLKAACHGIVMGSLLPVLAYNLRRGKYFNSFIYLALITFEACQVGGHIRDSHGS